jgi:hypothetical protein
VKLYVPQRNRLSWETNSTPCQPFLIGALLLIASPLFSQPAAPPPDQVKTSLGHFLRPVLGAGFNLTTDDATDFKIDTTLNRLFIANQSRFRVAATVGFWVPWSTCGVKWERWLSSAPVDPSADPKGNSPRLPACYTGETPPQSSAKENPLRALARHWRMRSGFIVNFQLHQSASSANAFSLGYGIMVRPGVIFQASYTRAKSQELSPGFRRAAAAAVRSSSATDPAFALWRGRLNADESSLARPEEWDGFPLQYGDPARPIFTGTPLIDTYKGSFTLGIAIPLDRILRTSGN